MEKTLFDLCGYFKKGADDVIAFVDGLWLVGPYVKYFAYGFAVWSAGSTFFGWW